MKQRTKSLRNKRSGVGMGLKPPQFESTFQVSKKLRFTATAAITTAILRGGLLDLLVAAQTATAAGRIFDAVKVRRIRIWGNAPGAGAVATRTSGVQWLSTYSPAKMVSDSGSGATYGARIDTKPPAMSLAGFWSLTGIGESEALFALQLNQGDVVDIDFTFRLQNISSVRTSLRRSRLWLPR